MCIRDRVSTQSTWGLKPDLSVGKLFVSMRGSLFRTQVMHATFLVLLLCGLAHAELKMVITLSRHGARAPLHILLYPGQFKEKMGELTTAGIRQAYKLGKEFRRRFIDEASPPLLNATYNPIEVFAKTSSRQRCYMTMYSLLLGLYGEKAGQKIEPALLRKGYPPFNVTDVDKIVDSLGEFATPLGLASVYFHVSNEKKDDLFFSAHKPIACPYVKERLHNISHSEEFRNKTEYFKETIAHEFAEALNADREEKVTAEELDIKEMKRLYDSYKVALFHGKRTPNLTPELVKKLYDLQFFYLYNYKYGDETVRKIATTYVLNEMAYFLKGKAEGREDITENIVLYTGHDSNLVALLRTLLGEDDLKELPGAIPPFASTLFIELHKEKVTVKDTPAIFLQKQRTEEKYVVKISFNDFDIKPVGCGKMDCTLDQFLQLVKDSTLDNIDEVCHHGKKPEAPSDCQDQVSLMEYFFDEDLGEDY
eukprot:TRINITY_DN341_c0_g1_i1.p1 TRINITY_DN341_c0_g1~~TRINITY_DN341_c0_g1_i1.p1  ORF type:complete len:499 (-),score=145.93 TRINITY_DN341_c0_g1_i1:166-1602(-)